MSFKPFLIGITGGSASGKTYFLKRLLTEFAAKQLCLISQDHYYKPIEQQPLDHSGMQNFDMPESIDFEAFRKDIQLLSEGKEVTITEYTFNNPDKVPKQICLKPAPIILVEGIFVFYYRELLKSLDLKVFIDSKEHIKFMRRIKRDLHDRGYDMEDIMYRYQHHVAPTFERYILPFRDEADLIIPNNTHFDVAFEVISAFIRSKLPVYDQH